MPTEIIESKEIHRGFVRFLLATLRLEGGKGVSREIIVHGRASAVLPYDARRRMVMLVKLLRAPVLLASGAQEVLEAPAGMIEDGNPGETARREALEETGLRLGALEHVGSVWTSPGISTEKIDLYLAPYAAGDRVSAGGGLASEDENITVVEMPIAEFWATAERLEIADMKTLTLALALRWKHPGLFEGPSGEG
jgi:nudix-type nucleoside diphosphatase (YffH/AdpP family)